MSVKTLTLATIIYPTWASLNITSPALVKNGQGGGRSGILVRQNLQTKICVLGPNRGWPSTAHQLLSKYL